MPYRSLFVYFFIAAGIGILFSSQNGWAQVPGDIITIGGGAGDGALATNTNLNTPRGVSLDRDGNLYIADTGRHRIRKITLDGRMITIAGDGYEDTNNAGRFAGDDGPATAASLNFPTSVFVDTSGIVYIADTGNHRIRKVDAAGIITTVAGDGIARFAGDTGLARTASLNEPRGIFVHESGIIYIADYRNHRIRKVDAAGIVTTIAGDGDVTFDGDGGSATQAGLNFPASVFLDDIGNLYIADTGNQRIRRVDAGGIITTVAGDGDVTFDGDGGPAIQAGLSSPVSIFLDDASNLYIADTGNQRVRRVDAGGIITTIAGDGFEDDLGSGRFTGDGGPATQASLFSPRGVIIDHTGTVYVSDSNNNRIRKIDTSGIINTIAGNGNSVFAGDGGPATTANLFSPASASVDSGGQVYIADTFNHRIRKIDTGGIINTIVGDGYTESNGIGRFTGDNGPATQASLNSPTAVFVTEDGTLYIADTSNHRIRKIGTNGIITTIAGDGFEDSFGRARFAGDGGSAIQASLDNPIGVYVNQAGVVYIADTSNHRIRKIDTDGVIRTIAGNGNSSFAGDGGPATQASLSFPSNVWVDGIGSLYIADTANHLIRKVTPDGVIRTIAGDGFENSNDGSGRFAGDGGPATQASLNFPTDIVLGDAGDIYIADTFNHRIRRMSTEGEITTVAGDGFSDSDDGGRFTGDGGIAVAASLDFPRGVVVDHNRNVYIADTNNHRIRKVIGQGPALPEIITLVTFTGTEERGVVSLEWTTDQIPTQNGFNLYRSTQLHTGFVKLNPNIITGETISFVYLDREALESDLVYYYELEIIDVTGASERYGPVSVQVSPVTVVELFQNAPNPFNPGTVIQFALPAPASITFRIYNLLGQEVATLLDKIQKPAGFDVIRWDGTNARGERVASGVYLYQLTTGTGVSQVRRMVLLR